MVDRRALAGGPALTGPAHRGIFQILTEYKYVNKMGQQTAVQMLLEYVKQRGLDLEYEMEMSFLDHEKEQTIAFTNDYITNVDWSYQGKTTAQYYNEKYSK
jgi:hypothetical protein